MCDALTDLLTAHCSLMFGFGISSMFITLSHLFVTTYSKSKSYCFDFGSYAGM